MKKSSIILLQIILVLFGVGIFVAMLWEPHLEGRNINATVFEIYFQDPFLVFVYLGSIPFFVALSKAFQLLSAIGRNELFVPRSVQNLRTIKYCMFITAATIVATDTYLSIAMRGKDDFTGAVMLGMITACILIVIATAAAVCERMLQNAVDMKLENDLTV